MNPTPDFENAVFCLLSHHSQLNKRVLQVSVVTLSSGEMLMDVFSVVHSVTDITEKLTAFYGVFALVPVNAR